MTTKLSYKGDEPRITLKELIERGFDFTLYAILTAIRGPDIPSKIYVPLKNIFTARIRAIFRQLHNIVDVRLSDKVSFNDIVDAIIYINEEWNHYMAHISMALTHLSEYMLLNNIECIENVCSEEVAFLSLLAILLERLAIITDTLNHTDNKNVVDDLIDNIDKIINRINILIEKYSKYIKYYEQ